MFFRRHRRATAVLTRPYPAADVEALRAYAAGKGLVVHMPPEPTAAFWFPGFSHCVVLTAPEFGEVKWHPAQLAFRLTTD